VRRRHANVDNREIWRCATNKLDERRRVPGLADDFVAGAAEEAGDTLAQQDVIVSYDDPTTGPRPSDVREHYPLENNIAPGDRVGSRRPSVERQLGSVPPPSPEAPGHVASASRCTAVRVAIANKGGWRQ